MNKQIVNLDKDAVDEISQKVQNLISNVDSKNLEMSLPKHRYEPFFLKIMNDFKSFHKIPDVIKPPQGNTLPHKLFSYILDLMCYSMGQEKRESILKELDQYKQGLPFDMR